MKQKILLLCLLFSLLVFSKAKANETEPNNTAAQANTLTLNGSNSGAIAVNDIDWFKVTLSGDGALMLNLTETTGQYASCQLYDADGITTLGARIDASNGTGTTTIDGLAAGTYYIKINAYYNGQMPAYSISNTLIIPAQANDAEPNGTKTQALTLPLNGSKTGHIGYYYNNQRDTLDWYKITTTGDGLIKLNLTSGNANYVSGRLYDADGTTQLGYLEAANNTSATSVDGLAAGTYYVAINAYYNNQFVPYVITDSLFTPKQANDKEPDSTKALALTLPLNGSATGHIGYLYNNHRDSADWYKITTTSDGLVKLILTSANGNYVSARLFDNDGTTQLAYVEVANSTSTISTDGLAAGTYYVKVNTFYSNQFAPYVIADSLFTPKQANDKEPDSTKALALTLPLNGSATGHIGYLYNNHRDSADWYKITTTSDGLIKLLLTSANGNYLSARLFDNDGTTQLAYVEVANSTSSISTDGLAAGTYYVKINTYYNGQFAPYVIADSLFTYNPVDSEPNKYFSQAKTILSNRVSTGHVGFYYNNIRDTVDTYKVNYTGNSGNLNFTFNLLPHKVDGSTNYMWLQVYKDTSAAPVFSNNFSATSTQINLTGLSEGYYYIKIFAYYNSQFEAYSVADSFVQVNTAKISINTLKTTLNSAVCGADSITYNLSGSHSPYTVRLYKNATLYDSTTTSATTVTFKGLSAGNYYATVYGDGATDSAYSKSATSIVTPPVPTALATTGIGVHTATLNWTKLSCANYYKVQYRAVGSPTWIVINTKGDTSKLALTGLSPYTLYAWQVASVDTTKGLTFTSAFADSITFRTLSDTAHIALTFKGVGAVCNSDTLTYTSTNSQPPYTVTLYRNGVVYGSPLSVTSVASFYNVPPGNYYATSTGTGSGGSFGKSDTTQILPPPPTGLSTTSITSVSAVLNWSGVSCSNFYTIQYKATGTAIWTNINSSKDSLMVMNLLPATKYTWHVSASDSANKQTVSSVYSDSATFTTSGILPVTFVSFNGKLVDNSVQLNWSTATETNNKGYEVEKSNDGSNFTDLSFVQGKGNTSTISNYTYTDVKVAGGDNYYRLKQIDFDGRFTYSSVIKINYSKFDWSIAGNPSGSNTWIQLQLDKQTKVSIQVLSINGSMHQIIDKGSLSAGTYSIPLNVNNLSSGIYIVRLITNNQVSIKKFLK